MASILPLLLLPVLMYFLIIRPQQKKVRAQQELLSTIGEGDEVMTTSGIYGYVEAQEGDTVWLEIADGVTVRILRAAISKKVSSASDVVESSGNDGDADDDGPTPG